METVLRMTEEMLCADVPPEEIHALLRKGLKQVDERCEAGKYFIADLIMANNIYRNAVARITGYYAVGKSGTEGRVLMGTVQDDIHELGKNLISIVLQNSGFETMDLGADVSPKQFCDGVLTYSPDILVLSGTLSGGDRRMAETIRALETAGIRNTVKVLLGGNCITEQQAMKIGADAYSGELFDCIRICRQIMEGRE